MKAVKISPGKVVHISDDDEVWFDPDEWKYRKAKEPTFVLKRNLLQYQVAKECGLIPEDFTGKVVCVDGNPLNCQRSNLRLTL